MSNTKNKKAVKPLSPYGEKFSDSIEPFPFIACVCPTCNSEVPYANYCLECGQKFIQLNNKE